MLSDRDLQITALEQGLVTPFVPENCEGATINLTLNKIIRKYQSSEPIILGNPVTEQHYEIIDIHTSEFWLQPGESVLVSTVESVSIPDDLSSRVYERYSIKSLGLMISPAHYMNPGYRGTVGLLAINHNSVPIRLTAGIKICQLALFQLSSDPLKPYEKQDGKYMDTTSASISKLHLDKEIQGFLQSKGIEKIPNEMAEELSEHLMGHIRKSAKELADILRKEFGDPKVGT